MTPSRLLSTTRNGFERELLRSAGTERAPDAVRARVLLSVAQACSGALAMEQEDEEPHAPREPWLVERGRGGRWVLGAGLLGLAASLGLVLWQRLPHRSLARDPGPEHAPAVPLEPVAATEPQQTLASTSVVTQSEHGALQVPAQGSPPDWLGAQLQLLGEARRQLENGSLEQAQGLLEGYELRFPGGVLGPQISTLRAELRRRQAERMDQARLERSHSASEWRAAEPTAR